MEVNFRISDYNIGKLAPQLSMAMEYKSIKDKLYKNRNQPTYGRDMSKMSPIKAVEFNAHKRRRNNRILGVVFLAAGLLMMSMAGLLTGYETLMTVFGVIAIVLGVFSLWNTQKSKVSRFDNVAKTMLTKFVKLENIRISFTEEGMKVANRAPVPYSKFDYAAECQDLFYICWGDEMITLQKKDAITGNYRKLLDAFRAEMKDPSFAVSLMETK